MNSTWELHDLQALLIDLGRNLTPDRICILQLWLFAIRWVVFMLLAVRGAVKKLANLFQGKHAGVTVHCISYLRSSQATAQL